MNRVNPGSFLHGLPSDPEVEARLQDNRSRILQAARALVSEGGWTEAQVASVAAAAGIATGTVYRYFPSKAELFAEVLALVSQREVDVLAAIARRTAAPPCGCTRRWRPSSSAPCAIQGWPMR